MIRKKAYIWAMLKYFRAILFVIFTGTSLNSHAQEVPEIIHFSKEQYQGANQNWMFSQDCDNNLYVANSEGVLVYNGMNWRLVPIKGNRRPRALFLGADCKIYTGGYETFGYLNMENPSSPKYIEISESAMGDSKEEIWNIFKNGSDLVFQSFADLYFYDFKSVKHVKPPSNVMFGNQVSGRTFLPKIESGLYEIKKDEFYDLNIDKYLPERTKITGIVDFSNKILIATQLNGIFFLDEKNTIRSINSELNGILKKEEINKILRLSDGNLVIGTILNGIYFLDKDLHLLFHINKQNGLSNNTVLSLFEDHRGNVWIGLDKGINLVKYNSRNLFYYDKQGLLGTVYSALKTKNYFYLGTNQGVFRRKNGGNFDMVPGSQGQVWSLLEANGALLCGHNAGTFVIDANKIKSISEVTGGWDMKQVNDTTILQSTYTGLILIKYRNEEWTFDKRVANGNALIERFAINGRNLLGYHAHYGIIEATMSTSFDSMEKIDFHSILNGEEVKSDVVFYEKGRGFEVLNSGKVFYFENGIYTSIGKNVTQADDLLAYYKSVLSKPGGTLSLNADKNLHPFGLMLISNDDGYQLLSFDGKLETKDSLVIDYTLLNEKLIPYHALQHATLDANQNNLVFYLKNKAENLEYLNMKYQLIGWDSTWYDIPSNGILQFRNLNGGKYQLLLSEGDKEPRELVSFAISPHWYESWKGLALMGFLLTGGFWYFDKWHTKNLEREKEKLRKEKELELQSQRMKANNEKLEHELVYKAKMLANSTMTLVQKNNMLNELKAVIAKDDMTEANRKKWKQKALHLIDKNLSSDEEWEIFEQNFAEVHEDFLTNLLSSHPDLTNGEQKLAAYIKMDLSSKEIAPLLNISLRSVENKRYRLRKKLDLEHDDNLSGYLLKV